MQKIHQSRCHYQLYEELIKSSLSIDADMGGSKLIEADDGKKERADDILPVRVDRPAHNNDDVFN